LLKIGIVIWWLFFLEPMGFAMDRRMLLGVDKRAERRA
jgi:hypothetical protein